VYRGADVTLPEFLSPLYESHALDQVDSSLAALDQHANILWVNEGWKRFALANGGDASLERFPSYLDGIGGPLRDHFQQVLASAITSGEVFQLEYHCSTPDTIREFRMRVLPFPPAGLLVEHTPITAYAAPAGEAAIEAVFLDEHQQIHQCSNCRRVRKPTSDGIEVWAWVPEWVVRSHPQTSHGLCTPCRGYYYRRRPRRGA